MADDGKPPWWTIWVAVFGPDNTHRKVAEHRRAVQDALPKDDCPELRLFVPSFCGHSPAIVVCLKRRPGGRLHYEYAAVPVGVNTDETRRNAEFTFKQLGWAR